MMKVQASAPGKLFLAGEYAVVAPGNKALIAAIDQYITVQIMDALTGTIFSSQQGQVSNWSRVDRQVQIGTAHSYDLIVSAMQVAEDYIVENQGQLKNPYTVTIESQLDNPESGRKYGLGSSGAVTVATIRAVLAYYGQSISDFAVYQLAVIAQMRLGMTGSFGDIAASSFGGIVAYQSVDREWLRDQLPLLSITDLMAVSWKSVAIQSISLPKGLELLIGWTGEVARTDHMIERLETTRGQSDKETLHQIFLQQSKDCVEALIAACQQHNPLEFQRMIQVSRQLLVSFAKDMGFVIETPDLEKLCAIATEVGAAAKSSGAGGGDCGICFIASQSQAQEITKKWRKEGILPLPFQVAERNEEK